MGAHALYFPPCPHSNPTAQLTVPQMTLATTPSPHASTMCLLPRPSLSAHLQCPSICVSLTASPAYPKRGLPAAHLGPLEPTEKRHPAARGIPGLCICSPLTRHGPCPVPSQRNAMLHTTSGEATLLLHGPTSTSFPWVLCPVLLYPLLTLSQSLASKKSIHCTPPTHQLIWEGLASPLLYKLQS